MSEATAKVAVLHPVTTAYCEWAGCAEDLARGVPGPPAFEMTQQAFLAATNLLLELGVDYDYLFEDVLMSADTTAGAIRTSAAAYELLIVPNVTCLTKSCAEKLAEFLDGGGRTVFINSFPEWTDGDAELLQRISAHIGKLSAHEPNGIAWADHESGTRCHSEGHISWIVSGDMTPGQASGLADGRSAQIRWCSFSTNPATQCPSLSRRMSTLFSTPRRGMPARSQPFSTWPHAKA